MSHLHGIQREPAGGLARRGAGQQKDLRVRRAAVAHGAVMLPAPAGEVPRQPPPSPAPLELVLHLDAHDSDVVSHFQRAMIRSDQLKCCFFLPLHSGSSRARPPQSPKNMERRVSLVAFIHFSHAHFSFPTCVDDSASSANVHILKTELFTSTGKKTKRM